MLTQNTLNKIVYDYQHGGVKNYHPKFQWLKEKPC
jgi:hypothetical protein